MANNIENPEAEADRLEAALERIAQAVVRDTMPDAEPNAMPGGEEIAARLDGLIDRLRTVLGNKAD